MMQGFSIWVAVVCAAGCGLASSAVALAEDRTNVDSIYSEYNWEMDCTVIDASPPEGPGAYAQLLCPGPGDLHLMLSDDDGRISLDYAKQPQFGPWESFQTFNDVARKLEWRRQGLDGKMVPFATIHRWFVGAGEQQRQFLVVSTVARSREAESCMVGYIDATNTQEANKMARRVADHVAEDFRCGEDRPRAYGWVDPTTPTTTRAGH